MCIRDRYYGNSWRKWFCKGKREKALQLLQQEMRQLDQLREAIHRINMDLVGYTQKEVEIRQQQTDCGQQFTEKWKEIQRWTSYWNPLMKAASQLHINKFTAGVAAVSYTHLDVYKRQVHGFAAKSLLIPSFVHLRT